MSLNRLKKEIILYIIEKLVETANRFTAYNHKNTRLKSGCF